MVCLFSWMKLVIKYADSAVLLFHDYHGRIPCGLRIANYHPVLFHAFKFLPYRFAHGFWNLIRRLVGACLVGYQDPVLWHIGTLNTLIKVHNYNSTVNQMAYLLKRTDSLVLYESDAWETQLQPAGHSAPLRLWFALSTLYKCFDRLTDWLTAEWLN